MTKLLNFDGFFANNSQDWGASASDWGVSASSSQDWWWSRGGGWGSASATQPSQGTWGDASGAQSSQGLKRQRDEETTADKTVGQKRNAETQKQASKKRKKRPPKDDPFPMVDGKRMGNAQRMWWCPTCGVRADLEVEDVDENKNKGPGGHYVFQSHSLRVGFCVSRGCMFQTRANSERTGFENAFSMASRTTPSEGLDFSIRKTFVEWSQERFFEKLAKYYLNCV